MLDLERIRISLRCQLDIEAWGREIRLHFTGAKESEIKRESMSPPLVDMDQFCTDMKGKKKQPARPQHPAKFSKRGNHAIARNVDERVERNDSLPGLIGNGERGHVRLLKPHGGIQSSGALDHSRGEVNSGEANAAIMEGTPGVARAASDIGSQAEAANSVRELIKKLALKWFVPNFRHDRRSVVVCDGVVAGPQIVAGLIAHARVEPADLSLRPTAGR